jgi:putative PIG3 family NAD(P)H quinone oxidoreductase
MICVEISEFGGPEVLRPVERPDPVPGPGEVLIQVAAAGVNRPDVMQRRGAYPPPPHASDIPGLEVSGTIAALGPGVTTLREGDQVCALVTGGGYATRCLAPAPQCLPVPDGIDMVSAAAIPETYFTVWSNVFDRGRLRAGETALFHGGSSGIGTTAIQLAAARGARVFATAGSEEKCRACEALGASHAINYRTTDFVEATRALTERRGVDLILDIMGGSYTPRNLSALAVDGRLVQIGLMSGETVASVDLRRVLGGRLCITGSTLRPRTVEEKGQIAQALLEQVWPLITRGAVRPVVYRTFPLQDAAAAHALMESSEHIGKIVLTAGNGR